MKRFSRFFWILVFIPFFQTAYAQNAVENFDALWEIFDKNYATFEEKGVDWRATYDVYRPKISAATTDRELFDIMTAMLRPLDDAHVSLKAKNLDAKFSASRPSRIMEEIASIPARQRKVRINRMIGKTLQGAGFTPMKTLGPKWRGERLFSYTKSDKIGYLRYYRSFSEYYLMNGLFLNAQLSKIFRYFQGLDAMIVDVRFNIGGDDDFSKKIAGRFIDQTVVGFYKQTRKAGTFGTVKTTYLSPKGKSNFMGPVVVLTNDKSVSAADVFALMISQNPRATLVGERSNGSYSDLMTRKLPNGWKLTLSNQRYLSADKVNYEGRGTPVDIEVKNTLADVEQESDSVLKRALQFLGADN